MGEAFEKFKATPGACPQCWGCGKIVDDEDQTPKCAWDELPMSAKIPLVIGTVQVMDCPACKGSGKIDYMIEQVPWAKPERKSPLDWETPMTPADLSEAVNAIVLMAQDRVGPGSIGAVQYHVEGKPQKFESMDLGGLADYMLEEALDLINYGVMMSIRAYRMRLAANEASYRKAKGGVSAQDS